MRWTLHPGLLILLSASILTLCPGRSDAQTGGFDRAVREILVGPADATGARLISALIDLHASSSTVPLDLSLEVEVQVTRSRAVVHSLITTHIIQTDGGVGDCFGSCGGGCGGLYIDGVLNTMTCHVDGMLPGGGVDCNCGYWLMADMGTTNLQPGDEIMVLLRPAPGALPDGDPTNEIQNLTFGGDSAGWNRGVSSVAVVPNAAGGNDVQATFYATTSDPTKFHELSFDVDVLVNGLVVASKYVPLHAVPTSATDACDVACAGGTCADYQSEDPQQWIAPACAYYAGFVGCNCGSTLDLVIPDVGPLAPGDELMILLRPAPGALPELPGFPEDDTRRPPSPTATAPTSTALGAHLSQNSPNPFNPTTSIAFDLSRPGFARLEVYDIRGSKVKTLAQGDLGAGHHTVIWNGRDEAGRGVASGAYLFRLRAGGVDQIRKGVLLK